LTDSTSNVIHQVLWEVYIFVSMFVVCIYSGPWC